MPTVVASSCSISSGTISRSRSLVVKIGPPGPFFKILGVYTSDSCSIRFSFVPARPSGRANFPTDHKNVPDYHNIAPPECKARSPALPAGCPSRNDRCPCASSAFVAAKLPYICALSRKYVFTLFQRLFCSKKSCISP